MQVKKFEARTMKEALDMVKAQLGPDAIILSARDNNRSFGLVGQGSVEITAAVSEQTLNKKKFVESRIRESDRDKLMKTSAKNQRQVINQMVDRYISEKQEKLNPVPSYQTQPQSAQASAANQPARPQTNTRYIDIGDEETMVDLAGAASERIKTAAQRAWNAMHTQEVAETAQSARPTPITKANVQQAMATAAVQSAKPTLALPAQPQALSTPAPIEIQALRGEIASLKQVIAQFQNIPKTFSASPAHPGGEYGLCYEVSAAFEKLTWSGISEELAAEILTAAQEQLPAVKIKSKALVEAFAAKYILNTTKIVGDDKSKRPSPQLQIFSGPAGSGKTSSLIKMAAHLVVRERKKIVIVTADTQKVGGVDQMRIYAQILNVPFAVIRGPQDWEGILPQMTGFDTILVDFPGSSLKTMDEIQNIKSLMPNSSWNPHLHLVLSTLSRDSELSEIGKRYGATGFDDVIFTGLDESSQHGSIYNFMRKNNTQLHSFGIGTRVPEDFEMATKERVLDLIFKITKLSAKQDQR
jgi:flagellar biosynthesis protein FlhF